MDKALLRSFMVKYHETQSSLADALGISLSTLNAKINEYRGAGFNQNEIAYIKTKYNLTPAEIDQIFFANKVS